MVSSEDAGEGEKVELCLGGADRYVNEENKMQYLEAGTQAGAATRGTMKISIGR